MLTFRAQDLSGMLPASQHDRVAQNVHSAANLRLAGAAQKAKRGTTVDNVGLYQSGALGSRMHRRTVIALKADSHSGMPTLTTPAKRCSPDNHLGRGQQTRLPTGSTPGQPSRPPQTRFAIRLSDQQADLTLIRSMT